jgi:uncharacterized membrane protein
MEILQAILHFLGHGFCHQIPERSFEAGGLLFSVCSRDTGLYMGLVLSVAVAFVLHARMKVKPGDVPHTRALIVCLLMLLPMAFDGGTSYLGLRETNNVIRYVTGLLAGMGVGTLLAPVLMDLRKDADTYKKIYPTPLALLLHFAVVLLCGFAYLAALPYMGIVAALIPALGFVGIAVSVNLLILSLMRRFKPAGDKRRWLLLLALSAALAFIEIAAAGALRDITANFLPFP